MQLLSHASPSPDHPLTPRAGHWNRALDAALVRVPGTEAASELLQRNGALVVTTGQQPGLFTGPIYTVHKALAAAALARRLQQAWERPVVPIFWLAGDDHDYDEARTTAWLTLDGEVTHWALPPRDAAAPQRSMVHELLPPDVTEGLDALEQSIPAGEARAALMTWLRRHYRPGATVHAAYRDALAELLAPFGVLCLDPTHPAVKRAQVPLLQEALSRAGELDALLAALPDPGTGIAAGQGATLVFFEDESGRDRLLIDGAGFRTRRSGVRFTADDMQRALAETPERFSANVLLRPVVESALLPTVAYVAGPGEFRYLTRQAFVLYEALRVPVQRPVARWGGTVVEEWVTRILDRLQLTAAEVLDGGETLGRSILRRDLPAEVQASVAELQKQIARTREVLQRHGGQVDEGLVRSLSGRTARMTSLSEDLERRFERHLRRRGDIAFHQYRRVRAALTPDGVPQERVLTAAVFLGRYGRTWLDQVVTTTDAWAAQLPVGPAH